MLAFSSISYAADKTKSQSSVEKPSIEMMNSRMTELQKEMNQINNTKDSKQKHADPNESHGPNASANDLMSIYSGI